MILPAPHTSQPKSAATPVRTSGPRCPFHWLLRNQAGLAAELKAATAPQHTQAEHHPAQQAAVRGQATPLQYARLAAQLHVLHEALEPALNRAAMRDRRISAVFAAHCRRAPAFAEDLAELDPHGLARMPTAPALEAADWIHALERTQPIALLGVLYVVEGSTNGGQHISRILRKAWGWPAGHGLRSLDPHGASTHPKWLEFRAALDALQLTPDERQSILSAAGGTFTRITAMMDALHASA